ncbi:MAG: hypothetical protein ABH803_02925 [Candidatus Micrarchaeota archaeon]
MKIKDEVMKMIDLLQKSGFKPVDAVFEGALGVKEDTTLEFMDTLNASKMVSGVIRIIYTGEGEQVRFIEIPVGQQGEQQVAQELTGSGE